MNRTSTCLSVILLGLLSLAIAEPVSSSSAYLTENTWVSKASMQVARAYLGVGVVDGKIYAIGGDNSAIMGNVDNGIGRSYLVVNTTEQYDLATDTWTTKTSIPTARACFGTTVFQHKIYCIGGYTAEQVSYNASYGLDYKTIYNDSVANEVYDPVSNSWETKASLPTPLCYAQANTVGDKIYVTADFSSSVYIYDPAKDSWSNGCSAPYKISSMGAVSIGNKIFAVGVDRSENNIPDNPTVHWYIQAYDVSNNSWSIIGNSNTVDSTDNGIGATIGVNSPQRLYFFDQNSSSTSQSPVTQIYDVKNDSWSIGSSMSLNRLCAAVAEVNDTLYVIGGRSGQWGYITMENPSAVTEQYIPAGYGTIRPTYTVDFTIANQPFPILIIAAVTGASAIAVSLGIIYFLKKSKN